MADRTSVVPAARLDHLVMSHVGDEVLVYDQTTHAIHRLNATTHLVWTLCDGSRTLPAIAQAATAALGSEVPEAVVRLALGQLAQATLLAGTLPSEMREPRASRRVMLQRMAIAGGVALPALVSVTAPTAAGTVSCGAVGSTCTTGTCCSGLNCGGSGTSTCCTPSGQACSGTGYTGCCGGVNACQATAFGFSCGTRVSTG